MFDPVRSQLALCATLLVVLQAVCATGSAQDRPSQTKSQASGLGQPIFEIVAGGTLLSATPLVVGVIMLALGPGWFACNGELDQSDVDAECQREADAQRRRAAWTGALVGSVQVGAGAALLGHGAYRTRRIRVERRARLRPVAWQLRHSDRASSVGVMWSF